MHAHPFQLAVLAMFWLVVAPAVANGANHAPAQQPSPMAGAQPVTSNKASPWSIRTMAAQTAAGLAGGLAGALLGGGVEWATGCSSRWCPARGALVGAAIGMPAASYVYGRSAGLDGKLRGTVGGLLLGLMPAALQGFGPHMNRSAWYGTAMGILLGPMLGFHLTASDPRRKRRWTWTRWLGLGAGHIGAADGNPELSGRSGSLQWQLGRNLDGGRQVFAAVGLLGHADGDWSADAGVLEFGVEQQFAHDGRWRPFVGATVGGALQSAVGQYSGSRWELRGLQLAAIGSAFGGVSYFHRPDFGVLVRLRGSVLGLGHAVQWTAEVGTRL